MDQYLTVEEISKSLNIPSETIRTWLRKGKLNGIRLGRHWRIKETDLQEFLKR